MSERSIPTEDRISSLPDSIICHNILSLLPTKHAATTSILSKRWKPLWLSVPTLHFDDNNFPNYASFFRFVSSIFLSRDITLPIRSFYLKCSKVSAHQSHDINRFVYAVGQRGIENLDLEISGLIFFEVKLPPCIFNCRTLVVLRLEGFNVNDLSHVLVNFPLLKTLHLSYLIFKPVYLLKLLSGCPILEELQIHYIYPDYLHQDLERLILDKKFQCLPNLIRANISNLSSKANALFTLLCRAKFLCVELKDTSYSHFPTFQNLIHMELTLKHEHHVKWKWVIEVLKRCPKLQNLTIHQDSRIENEVMDNWLYPTSVPECLSTQLRTCLLKGYKSTECEVQFAKYIMQNAKVLNTMSIKSASPMDINVKYQMISKLASSARASTACELLFD